MKKGLLKGILLLIILFSVVNLSAVNLVEMFVNGGAFMYLISFLLVVMIILPLNTQSVLICINFALILSHILTK